jgi:uncharacterized membrane protein
MTIVLLTVIGVALIVLTALTTASQYRKLPERVPLHFNLGGTPGTFGPRVAIWLLVAVACSSTAKASTHSQWLTRTSQG